jgi:hypothetical protein
MTTASQSYGCDECKSHNKSGLERIGEPTEHEYFGGKGHETQTRYKCKSCGQHWVNYIESGLGGHGNTWAPKNPDVA